MTEAKPALSEEQILGMMETSAAIGADLFSKIMVAGEESFYDRHGEKLSGFPGVWRYAANAARIFSEEEFALGDPNYVNFDWVDALVGFSEWLGQVKEIPAETELRFMAKEFLQGSKY